MRCPTAWGRDGPTHPLAADTDLVERDEENDHGYANPQCREGNTSEKVRNMSAGHPRHHPTRSRSRPNGFTTTTTC